MPVEAKVNNPAPFNKEAPHYQGAYISIDVINVLDQPRVTFNDIDLLAQDIARKNILNPLTVAELGLSEADKYIDVINEVWGTQREIDELTFTRDEKGDRKYYVLIAGERRLRAFKKLDKDGCFDCQEEYGKGSCIQRHFGSRNVEVRLMTNVDAVTALDIQASENTHLRPAPEEEALFYNRYFKLKKRIDPNYKISQFARDVGKNPDTIANALRFCKLPDEIQNYVKDGTVSYGIAVELQRARDSLRLDGDGLRYWLVKALVNRFTVAEFSKAVSAEIETQRSNQTMLGIFSETEELDMRRAHFRKVVAQEMLSGLYQFIDYFGKVQGLFEKGEIGKKDSPFSVKSPLKIFKLLIEQEKRLLPHLQDLLSVDDFDNATTVLDNSSEMVALLETRFNKQQDGSLLN